MALQVPLKYFERGTKVACKAENVSPCLTSQRRESHQASTLRTASSISFHSTFPLVRDLPGTLRKEYQSHQPSSCLLAQLTLPWMRLSHHVLTLRSQVLVTALTQEPPVLLTNYSMKQRHGLITLRAQSCWRRQSEYFVVTFWNAPI